MTSQDCVVIFAPCLASGEDAVPQATFPFLIEEHSDTDCVVLWFRMKWLAVLVSEMDVRKSYYQETANMSFRFQKMLGFKGCFSFPGSSML